MSEAYSGQHYQPYHQPEPERREPICNIEAEQALLGGLLINNNAYDEVSDFLRPEHFFEPLHARLYETIAARVGSGQIASPVTLKSYFDADEALQEVGGGQYLARLAYAATTIINVADYGRTIQDLFVRREISRVAEEMQERAYDAPFDDPPKKQLEDAETALYQISAEPEGKREQHIGATTAAVVDAVASAYQKGVPTGISWGMPTLDHLIGRLLPGQVVYLGGPTSSGKTALAMNVVERIARAHELDLNGKRLNGGQAVVFSLEMPKEDLVQRYISQRAFVTVEDMINGKVSAEDWERIVAAGNEFKNLPIWIDDNPSPVVSQVRSKVKRLQRQQGVDLVVIDHLRFLRPDKWANSEHERISQITSTLKSIAKELHLPILCLMHLTKEHTKRDDHRPNLGDAYGSSAIEQDADVVAMVHREEYWLERNEPKADASNDKRADWETSLQNWRGKAEIILLKRRNGKGAGTRQLRFTPEYAIFTEFKEDDPATLAPGYQGGMEF